MDNTLNYTLQGAGTGAALGPLGAAAGALVGAGYGIYQSSQAKKGLNNLANKPMPNYTLAPEQQDYYNKANAQSQYGYNPAQTANFKQNVAQQYNTGYRNAVNASGGNLAQAISNQLGAQKLGAFNQFASQDAALQQQKFNQLGSVVNGVQGQYNLATGENIHRRYALEGAYGNAMRTGLENSAGGFMNAVGFGIQALGSGGANHGQAPAQLNAPQSFSNPVGQGYGAGSNYNMNQYSNPYQQVPQYNMNNYGTQPPVTTPNPY